MVGGGGVVVCGCVLFEKCIVDASIFILQCISNQCFWFVCFVRVFVVCVLSTLLQDVVFVVNAVVPVGCVGVVVSVLGRSVDALVPGADEGRGRPR